jgi:hypothetical protein
MGIFGAGIGSVLGSEFGSMAGKALAGLTKTKKLDVLVVS